MADIFLSGDYHHLEIQEGSTLITGEDVTIRSFVSLEVCEGATLELGNRVFINDHCTIRCRNHIRIGKDTMIGDGVRIFDSNHKYSNYHIEKLDFVTAPIVIGKNCWIGSNSVILKGVTIGDNVVIGANSLVYKNIPDNSIVMSKEDMVIKPRKQHRVQAMTLTASDTLEHFQELVEALPEVNFNVIAHTSISPYLDSFNRYENVTLWTNVHHEDIIEDILQKTDIYLDINHWQEVDNIVQRSLEIGKRVFAFEHTCHRKDIVAEEYRFDSVQELLYQIRLNINNEKEL